MSLRRTGAWELVALEYVATGGTHSRSSARSSRARSLAPYLGVPEGTSFTWTLHAWIWTPNPSGVLMPWNPRVTLATTPGGVAS